MKNLFYGILSFLLILFLVAGFVYDKQLEQDRHKGLIVIQKDNENHLFGLGEFMTFKNENDSIHIERVYQIFYNKYNVGDTIK